MIRTSIIYLCSAFCLLILLQGTQRFLSDHTGDMKQGEQTDGSQLYAKYCLTCHQVNGKGVRHMFPPLAGNEKITGKADDLIKIVLFGLQGPITVNETDYNQPMPPQAYLNDKQISDILTYIRSSWGNNAPPILASNVEKIRKQGNK
jgi:mono/diheme cytochrome c family protein